MYNFPNFDNDTRFIMVSELVRDIENGLFYKPSSLKSSYMAQYKELLRKCLNFRFYRICQCYLHHFL